MSVLALENLSLAIAGDPILRSVSWRVGAGEILGIVGESGSGKSMSLMAAMGLAPSGALQNGAIKLGDCVIAADDESAWRKIRGAEIGVIFQEPMTALNPVQTVGRQVAEPAQLHIGLSAADALALAGETLARVGLEGIPISRYPYELSGGQRQRVAIAMAIVAKPRVILADEPTTALDVTTQKTILDLLAKLAREDKCGLVFVTHDLPLIAHYADRIAIMKDGAIVETGDSGFSADALTHPYSKALLKAATCKLDRTTPESEAPSLEISNLVCAYRRYRGVFSRSHVTRAVDDVSLTVHKGETVAIVGESGCGKSTLARAALGIGDIQSGHVDIDGVRFARADARLSAQDRKSLRRRIQIVFQDPYGGFNPRHRVGRIVAEPFYLLETPLDKGEAAKQVAGLLKSVQLPPAYAEKYPHELSGGERQRVAIARALATGPDIIVLDEAVSALDVSVRAEVLSLLVSLREEKDLSYLFISHDLSIVSGFAHRTLVMREGKIVEHGPTDDIFANPQSAYTKELIAAAPKAIQ